MKEIKNYFIKETDENQLRSKKQNKLCVTEHFHGISIAITGGVLISNFDSLVGILIEITSSALGLKTCAKL